MKTSKPFSTISYNTPSYLFSKLSELVQSRKIEFFSFIEHLPEDDEKKIHIHLFIIPNGRVDTDQIIDYLTEIDPEKPDKPLGCIMCRSSKFGDWYLYALHDRGYLAQRGQARKYSYQESEMQVSDTDYLRELIHTVDYSPYTRFLQIRQYAVEGIPFSDLVMQGLIPIQQTASYEKAYQLMCRYSRQAQDLDT